VSAGNFGLVISRSIDGANTWSTPIAATNPEFLSIYSQFNQAVAVLDDGTVGVMYTDFRFYHQIQMNTLTSGLHYLVLIYPNILVKSE